METIHYTLYREDADFVAQCIDSDVSSFGATEVEALANLREAVELYLEDLPEEKSPVISQVTVGELGGRSLEVRGFDLDCDKGLSGRVQSSPFLFDLLLIFLLAEGIYLDFGRGLGFPSVFVLLVVIWFGGGWLVRWVRRRER